MTDFCHESSSFRTLTVKALVNSESVFERFQQYPEHRSDLLRYLSLDSLDFNAAGAGGNFGDNNGDDDANEEGEEDDGDAYDDAENDYDMENADEMNAEADMAGEMPSPNDDQGFQHELHYMTQFVMNFTDSSIV